MSVRIDIPHEEITAFCSRNRIRKLAFFGSVLRDDFRPDSDVDVLVEFEPGFRGGGAVDDRTGVLDMLDDARAECRRPGQRKRYRL